MSSERGVGRREFIALGAAGLAAAGIAAQHAGRSAPPLIEKPLPEKVYNTASAGISARTHDLHREIYREYVARANDLRTRIAAISAAEAERANPVFSELRELKLEYAYALSAVRNHELYFASLGGRGGLPAGPTTAALIESFGSVEAWRADFRASALAARGWVWLAVDLADGRLFNYLGDSEDSPALWGALPVLAIDLHEHAYYLDFAGSRARYVDSFLSVLDWDAAGAALARARSIAPAV